MQHPGFWEEQMTSPCLALLVCCETVSMMAHIEGREACFLSQIETKSMSIKVA